MTTHFTNSLPQLCKRSLYLIILLSILGCRSNTQNKRPLESKASNSKIHNLNPIQNELSQKNQDLTSHLLTSPLEEVSLHLKEEKGLIPIGLITEMFYEDKKIHESFRYFNEININSGRELMVYIINSFAKTYNENKCLQEYFNKPTLLENIEIEVFKENGDETYSFLPQKEQLAIISYRDGKLIYETCDSTTMKIHKIHEETFKEAVRILSRPSLNS